MASLLIMGEAFYTSTEASKITGCSRRQLEYWRRQEVIVPTVNPGGKGRNVYYSESDLADLAIMEYLLSMHLNFNFCVSVLYRLKSQPVFLFSILLLVNQGLYKLGLIIQRQYEARDLSFKHFAERGVQLMLLPQRYSEKNYHYDKHFGYIIEIEYFDSSLAKRRLKEGYPVIPFLLDRIYKTLQDNLKLFHQNQNNIKQRK